MTKLSFFERLALRVSPTYGARRVLARAAADSLVSNLPKMRGGYIDRGKRSFAQWSPPGGTADDQLNPDLDYLREYSSDLIRTSPFGYNFRATKVRGTVGAGIRPVPQVDPVRTGLSPEAAKMWGREARAYFMEWADSPLSDFSRASNYWEQQRLAYAGAFERGDSFAVHRTTKGRNLPVTLALQLIEADRVRTPSDKQSDRLFSQGIEYNAAGEITHAWIAKDLRKNWMKAHSVSDFDRVPYHMNDGLPALAHIMLKERIGQSRGQPAFAPLIESLKQLTRYREAELDAAVISSYFTVFIRSPGAQPLAPMAGMSAGKAAEAATDADYKLASGAIVELADGEEVETANPSRPNPSFAAFVDAMLQELSSALGVPVEVFNRKYTSSYSAAKAAFGEAWKTYQFERSWFSDRFDRLTWYRVVYELVANGKLSAPGFFEDPSIRSGYLQCSWAGPGRGMLDEGREVAGIAAQIDLGIKTHQQATLEVTGGDWDSNIDQVGLEKKAKAEALPQPKPAPGFVASDDEEAEEEPDDDSEDEDK